MSTFDSLVISRARREDLAAVVELCMMVEAQHEAYWALRWKTKPGIREGYLRWMNNRLEDEKMLIGVARDPGAARAPNIPEVTFRPEDIGVLGPAAPNPTNVVGAILVGIQDEIPIYTFRNYAFIHDLAVATDYRRRGVGTRLLALARDWSVGKGLTQLRLMVADANGDARAAFERAGYRVTYHEMVLPLEGGGGL